MKVSVALCTYNGERYIGEQIKSILEQILPVDELVICDDKSTDRTEEIIKHFQNSFPDKIKYLQNVENVGAIKSFERCISACYGDIIFLSDQDDVWHKDKVAKILELFNRDENALMVFSDGTLIDENGNVLPGTLWSKWNFTEELRQEWRNNNLAFWYLVKNYNKITGATVAFKKDLKETVFPFELPEKMWHDAWLGIIASGKGGLRFIEEPTISYRVHSNQQIGVGNGVSLISGDKKFPSISYEEFQKKVENIFPKKRYLIYSQKLSIITRCIKRIKKITQKLKSKLNYPLAK